MILITVDIYYQVSQKKTTTCRWV